MQSQKLQKRLMKLSVCSYSVTQYHFWFIVSYVDLTTATLAADVSLSVETFNIHYWFKHTSKSSFECSITVIFLAVTIYSFDCRREYHNFGTKFYNFLYREKQFAQSMFTLSYKLLQHLQYASNLKRRRLFINILFHNLLRPMVCEKNEDNFSYICQCMT